MLGAFMSDDWAAYTVDVYRAVTAAEKELQANELDNKRVIARIMQLQEDRRLLRDVIDRDVNLKQAQEAASKLKKELKPYVSVEVCELEEKQLKADMILLQGRLAAATKKRVQATALTSTLAGTEKTIRQLELITPYAVADAEKRNKCIEKDADAASKALQSARRSMDTLKSQVQKRRAQLDADLEAIQLQAGFWPGPVVQ